LTKLVFWLAVGFLGQALFTARMVVQWVASERQREIVVPVAFWWLSLLGGIALFSYAIFRCDPVVITGQGMGILIYTRHLMLVEKARRRVLVRSPQQPVYSQADIRRAQERLTHQHRGDASGFQTFDVPATADAAFTYEHHTARHLGAEPERMLEVCGKIPEVAVVDSDQVGT
jgi:lipid-A-disaccharide synthase-like uncharacterized protein